MKTHTTTTYSFAELSDSAKEKALDETRDIHTSHEWWDMAYEEFKTIGTILGIDIENIWFSGFSSQGDGLCFEGSFQYAKGWRKELSDHAPVQFTHPDTGVVTDNPHNVEYHKLGERLQELQRNSFYGIHGTVKHRGHYQHSGCTDFDVRHNWDGDVDVPFDEEDVKQVYRELMDTFYCLLNREHDYLISDEHIEQTITESATEFEFYGDGTAY